MKNQIDMNKVNNFIKANILRKPPYITVDDKEWEDALWGYQETFSEAIDEQMTTEQFWSLVYFSAIAFCKGFEYAQVMQDLKQNQITRGIK